MWHFCELTEALYHLSVNDNIKFDIYETFHAKNNLKRVIYSGNEIEKELLTQEARCTHAAIVAWITRRIAPQPH